MSGTNGHTYPAGDAYIPPGGVQAADCGMRARPTAETADLNFDQAFFEEKDDEAAVREALEEIAKAKEATRIAAIKRGVWVRAIETPEIKSIEDYVRQPSDRDDILLDEGFLERKCMMMFVGPTGVGKSSASMQMDVLWALGREAFGIAPPDGRPLRILYVQEENTKNAMMAMKDGVYAGLQISEADRALLAKNFFFLTVRNAKGPEFLATLEAIMLQITEKFGDIDIVHLDPLSAYASGDLNAGETSEDFLRMGIGPLIERFNCGAIINHHTSKTINRDTTGYRKTDWAYVATGTSAFGGTVRSILVIDPTHASHIFRFYAGKGQPTTWLDEDKRLIGVRYFCHMRTQAGGIYWRDGNQLDIMDAEEAAERAKEKKSSKKGVDRTDACPGPEPEPEAPPVPDKTAEELLALIPAGERVGKTTLIQTTAPGHGFTQSQVKRLLKELIDARRVVESPKTFPKDVVGLMRVVEQPVEQPAEQVVGAQEEGSG